MGQKDLVQKIVGNHQCGNVDHGAGADVEQELVAVTGFHQPAGRRLVASRCGQTGTASKQANLILVECLGARVIDIAVRGRAGRTGYLATGGMAE